MKSDKRFSFYYGCVEYVSRFIQNSLENFRWTKYHTLRTLSKKLSINQRRNATFVQEAATFYIFPHEKTSEKGGLAPTKYFFNEI